MATKDTREPILMLESFAPERPKVSINGKAYEMRLPEEFSLRERASLRLHARNIAPLQRITEATDFELDEAEQSVDTVFRMAYPDVPDAVMTQMLPAHRQAFVEAFYERFLPTAITRPEPTPEEQTQEIRQAVAALQNRRTGGRSSRTSSASTAASAA